MKRKRFLYLIICLSLLVANLSLAIAQVSPVQAAGIHRTDAVVLVNSASANYLDFQHFIQPYLDHYGVPYTVVDIRTTELTADIGDYALIIIGHRQLDNAAPYLDSTEQGHISAAVSGGTGLVNFDNELFDDEGTSRYTFIQDVFSFLYNLAPDSAEVTFVDADHFITRQHALNSSINMIENMSMTLADISLPGDVTAIATSSLYPFLAVTSYEAGRAVQWGSYDWMSHSVRGPLFGLDDLVWRSLVWAARKPFVMQGLPPFVTMRMDDTSGPLWWIHIANEVGFKPWAGIFTNDINDTEAADLKALVDSGKATTSIHAFNSGTERFFYFDHNNGQNFSDETMAANYAEATAWFTGRQISISKYVVPHYYEIGSNAFGGLADWGIKFIGTMMEPGQLESGSAWLNLGPFRLYEPGYANDRNNNPYYADYLDPNDYPGFFNCVTELRDITGYEWLGNGRTDVPTAIADGIEWLKRPLDSMALATLFSHEYTFIGSMSQENWRTILQAITSGIAGYDPEYVSMDYACQYLRAIHDSNISYGEYDPILRKVTTNITGVRDMDTRFYIFYENTGEIQDYLVTVPQAASQVQFILPGPLDHITVTPQAAEMVAGGAQQFSAQGYDVENNPIPGLIYNWSVDAGGTIDANGFFTAGITLGEYPDTIVASSGGIQGTASVTITEAILHHFTIDPISSPLFKDVPFPITIRARDASENPVVTYAGQTSLSVSSGTISPLTTENFSDGIWTGNVTLAEIGTGLQITATDGEITGFSNAFDVQTIVFPRSIWDDSATPTVLNGTDHQSIELGVKFRSDIAGYITGIRFYKGNNNTGTHLGRLWSTSGTELAQATFTDETASGWQEVLFSQPVAINANTTYVASYYSPTGYYSFTDYGLQTAVYNYPLKALANGEDGANGVYRYGAGFPTETYTGHAPNYWVDVLFDVVTTPDITPPLVISTIPISNASGVNITANIQITFNEAMDGDTFNGTTVQLSDGASNLATAISYNSAARAVIIDPVVNLSYNTTYTATIQGGEGGVADLAGNPLAADYSWSFTTSAPPPPPPDEGPGGPILVIADAGNPFGRYYAEILRAEGLNEFTVTDISNIVELADFAPYDIVILAEQAQALTVAQVALFTDWVTAGGNLIAMRPGPQLAGLLGLTASAGEPLSEGYLLVNTTSAPGAGIVGETIQYHGAADQYVLAGATSIATLYSDATTATAYPAVTFQNVGTSGGQAAAFTYDLAKSVIYTRQGNPAWAGHERDEIPPIRSNDLFYGGTEADWVNLNKVAIPQADEQQRLLANLILFMNQDQLPLPRFWYFPRGEKAVVVMTADDHGGGDVAGRFDRLMALSPSGCSLEDWECLRSSGYIYTSSNITDAQAMYYDSLGFEIGLHVNTGCADFTLAQLQNFYTDQISFFETVFPSLPGQLSERTHCIAWSDWASQPTVKVDHHIRLDTNYYYWFGEWIGDRPGFFTGSGIPMRFADLDGSMIDVYQATTQMTDESLQTYPYTIDTLLDRAQGPEGYYGVFTANIHTDGGAILPQSEFILASALSHHIPVVSGRQMANWLDGRNGSSFENLAWQTNTLTFDIDIGSGANGLQVMVPAQAMGANISGVTIAGQTVPYSIQTIKGIQYGFFYASAGNIVVSYAEDETPPAVLSVSPAQGAENISVAADVSATFSEPMDAQTINTATFELRDPSDAVTPASITYNSEMNTASLNPTASLIPSTQYTARVIGGVDGVKDIAGNPLATDFSWIFSTAAENLTNSIWENTSAVGGRADDSNSYELGVKFRSSQDGYITALRFYKYPQNTGTHVGHLWDLSGNLLGSATFIAETESGWQEVALSQPVQINADQVYVVSYSTQTGNYAYSANYFTSQGVSNPPLYALSAPESPVPGTNGVNNTTPGAFPNTSYNDSNYWVDVVFAYTLPADTIPPVITNVQATPGGSGTATISWTTDENATSLVSYGTSPEELNQSVSSTNYVTLHDLALTGLSPYTTYYYRVTSVDESNNSATYPETPVILSFTTPGLSFIDTTSADFIAGTLPSGCYISETENGEISLSPIVWAEFSGSTLLDGWSVTNWNVNGSYTFTGGRVSLQDALLAYGELPATFGPGRAIEFVATFQAGNSQHIGLATDLNNAPWAIFSTGSPGGNVLKARTSDGSVQTETDLSSVVLGSPHLFRIEWEGAAIRYYVDGSLVATHVAGVPAANMRPVASDITNPGPAVPLLIDWIRMSPYATSCIFTSRVFDAGSSANWETLSWIANLPSGTITSFSYRVGDSASPDSSWTGFMPVSASGASLGSRGRYTQYQVELSTTMDMNAPSVEWVSLAYNLDADTTAPTIIARSPAPDAQLVARNTSVTVQFSELMNGATINNTTFRLRAVGGTSDIPATISYAGGVATLTPTSLLGYGTTYQATIAGSVADPAGNSLGADANWSFTTLQTFTDTTYANFSAGAGGCFIDPNMGDGAVRLTGTLDDEFMGTALPAGWSYGLWGGSPPAVGGGHLLVNGSIAGTTTTYNPGVVLEFVATFTADTYQHAGFVESLVFNGPWAMFSTMDTTTSLYARAGATDTPITGNYLGTPHLYRIEWDTSEVRFYIDNSWVATLSVTISTPMIVMASDANSNLNSLSVDSFTLKPYLPPCTFTSRVIDAGSTVNWSRISWINQLPTDTSQLIYVRTGNTSIPDGTWSEFSLISSSGGLINRSSQYIQYQALLSTTDVNETPVLESVTITANETPTAILVSAFRAQKSSNANILTWESSSEVDVVGFNVYRQTGNNLERTAINQDLVLALSPGDLAGNRYQFLDSAIESGITYIYWLEVVTRSGAFMLEPLTVGGYPVFFPIITN